MRIFRITILFLFLLAMLVGPTQAQAMDKIDMGREVLAAQDGWGSEGTGVTGGSSASADHVYTVTNRKELVAALNDGIYPPPSDIPSAVPKIIYVSGVIDANVDDNNNHLSCEDYYRDGFTWDSFLATYDPAVWGRNPPTGPLENARKASANAQKARVRIRVGDNTTIVGLGKDATIRGIWFDLAGRRSSGVQIPRQNVIIRNITFEDTYDCFPAWSPTDGALGSWNAEYDSISLRETIHAWIVHNTFVDKTSHDRYAPQYFGVLFQMHDGLLDITNASDLVTVSWNQFLNHDKVMLIGSSDSAPNDVGRLRVTLHHNLFDGTGQRTPRVRYGQVHIYNNYYKIINNPVFSYAWGVGINSQIYAENNIVTSDQKIIPADLIGVYKGTRIFASNTLLNGVPGNGFVDVVAEYNALYDPDLNPTVLWTPTLFTSIDPTQKVIPLVQSQAGPMNW